MKIIYTLIYVLLIYFGINSYMQTVDKNKKFQNELNMNKAIYECAKLCEEKVFDKALICTQDLIRKYPENPDANFNHAYALMNNGKLEEAKQHYNIVLANSESKSDILELSNYYLKKMAHFERLKRHDTGSYYIDLEETARWKNPNRLKIYVYPDYQKEAILKKAFDEWDRASYDTVNFILVDSPQEADITARAVQKSELGKDVGGITQPQLYYLNRNPKEFFFRKAQIKVTMNDDNNNPIPDKEIYGIALHEIGHALGIQSHSPSIGDVMYYSTDSYAIHAAKLTNRDINTLMRIYGNI